MSSNQNKQRIDDDLNLLRSVNYKVNILDRETDMKVFKTKVIGPNDSPYEGGVWDVIASLPKEYPMKPPTINFITNIFHPNIDYTLGTVTQTYLEKRWSTEKNLNDVFEEFLPDLLRNPDTEMAINCFAAKLWHDNTERYFRVAKEYTQRYAMIEWDGEKEHQDDEKNIASVEERVADKNYESVDGAITNAFAGIKEYFSNLVDRFFFGRNHISQEEFTHVYVFYLD